MTKFTNAELRKREATHRANVASGLYLASWNTNKERANRAAAHYKDTQLKLANAIAELIKYRQADPNYHED